MKAATQAYRLGCPCSRISIHAAREGGDVTAVGALASPSFQSTPPVKAATSRTSASLASRIFQSTPPVKAATHAWPACHIALFISIHAAREGGDVRPYIKPRHPRLFQSTPPVKAATIAIGATVPPVGFQSTPPVKAATVTAF